MRGLLATDSEAVDPQQSSQASLRLPMDEAKADNTLWLRTEVKSPENRKCLAAEDDALSR